MKLAGQLCKMDESDLPDRTYSYPTVAIAWVAKFRRRSMISQPATALLKPSHMTLKRKEK